MALSSIDPITVVAFLLLLGSVAGAFVPGLPAGILSIIGVVVYWYSTGYAQPGTVLLVILLGTGLLAVLSDWLGGVVAARVGGASTLSAVLGGFVGLVFLFVVGPGGMLVGATLTVFAIEYARQRDARSGAAAAGAYVVGLCASSIAQALLTGLILLAMVVVAV